MISTTIYWTILLSTGFIAALSGALFNFFKKPLENKVLFFWYLTRFTADIAVFICFLIFDKVFFIIFQTSVIFETVLLSVLLNKAFVKDKFKLLHLFPLLILLIEIFNFLINGKIIQLGFIFYNLIASILLLVVLLKMHGINKTNFNTFKILFVFHAVSFIYSLFDNIIRDNIDLMKLVYPIFLFTIVFLNIHYIFNSWFTRKN